MAVGDAYVFPGFLTPVLTQLFFPKPPTTFLTCFCRGERREHAGKKSRLNRGSNSQPPGHESDTLTTEPPRQVFFEGKVYRRTHARRDKWMAGRRDALQTQNHDNSSLAFGLWSYKQYKSSLIKNHRIKNF